MNASSPSGSELTVCVPDANRLLELLSLWKDTFGDSDAFLSDFLRTAYSPDRCRCAILDGRVAAMLYWFDCEQAGGRIAYLYAVATRADLRGRGICHRLMEHTHRHLAAAGYVGAMLSPASDSLFDFYRGMGYTTVTTVGELECTVTDETVALRPISAEEYGRLRRELLPAGGVLQEGASLDFLATQAELYAGENILLSCRGYGERLLGLELLGDGRKAPAILHTLGYKSGSFRTPALGRQKPFAAYLPLTSAPPPTYLGLVFD